MNFDFLDDDEPVESKDSRDNKERASRWLKSNDRFFCRKEFGMNLSYYIDDKDIRISLSYPKTMKKCNDSYAVQTNQPQEAFEEELKGTVKFYLTMYHNQKNECLKALQEHNEDKMTQHTGEDIEELTDDLSTTLS
jgi:predicted SpoU family rRNA methylase